MTGFVTADARVISRGREPVDIRLCGPTAGYYLTPASDRMRNDLPGLVDVVPVQWIRLPQDTKRVRSRCETADRAGGRGVACQDGDTLAGLLHWPGLPARVCWAGRLSCRPPAVPRGACVWFFVSAGGVIR